MKVTPSYNVGEVKYSPIGILRGRLPLQVEFLQTPDFLCRTEAKHSATTHVGWSSTNEGSASGFRHLLRRSKCPEKECLYRF